MIQFGGIGRSDGRQKLFLDIDNLLQFVAAVWIWTPCQVRRFHIRGVNFNNIFGGLVVNDGAKQAILEQFSSLLPIGIVNVVNEFKQGEVISIMDENNVEFARGMANYSSAECRRIVGAHSNDIENILGYKNYDAVITRDNITELI